ncbi:MAG: DUF4058 domain-containing protein, partial [Planctomycetaceae bacterium]|nr:DUF4058 domain-containing protein [Planctomycetaceae bacterium]
MPIHNWKAAPVGLYHHFHQSWCSELCNGLNAGVLPAGYFALIDQRAIGMVPDVLTLTTSPSSRPSGPSGGVAVADCPPMVRHVSCDSDSDVYAKRANRVAVRNNFGEAVALIELVSPGNKDTKHSIRAFIEKATEFIANRVNLLVVDLFPSTPRDPQGIHKAIWDQFHEEAFELPPDKQLTLASYAAGDTKTAYVEVASV